MPRRAALYLTGAGAGMGLLILTWYAAFHVGFVERADVSILRGFSGLGHRRHVDGVASAVASLCDPRQYVFLCALPLGLAFARRRAWTLMAVAAILLGANVTTALLKPLLAHPRLAEHQFGTGGPAVASWPSGHATAAMALALCCVLAVPARWRPLTAALGGAFAVGVSYAFLTLEWHYPSDVLGGYLVAGTWTSLAVAAVLAAQGGPETVGPPVQRVSLRTALGPPAGTLAAALLLAIAVFVLRPHEVVAYTQLHGVFVAGAAAIAALGLALATGLMLALRR
jgi:membrane-associated phospholipid phosphatase